jgi:hypothetical protein
MTPYWEETEYGCLETDILAFLDNSCLEIGILGFKKYDYFTLQR